MFWLGVVLIVLAVGLVIAELFTGSGILLISGLVALVFGLVLVFTQGSLLVQITWWLVGPLIAVTIALIVFIVFRIIDTYGHKTATGKEDLLGQTAVVKERLDPEGTVFFQGEYWNAVSRSGRLEPGKEVIIEQIEGLKLYVVKKPQAGEIPTLQP